MTKRLTIEEFIERAKAVHGDKYDYSKVEYVNSHTKVNITCPVHGVFSQRAVDHTHNKQGCPVCAKANRQASRRFTKEGFIERAKSVHGDKYDYSKVDYRNSQTNITISCPIHGDWSQLPNNHLRGKGCTHCARVSASLARTKTTEQFIKSARAVHGGRYEYKKADYVGRHSGITITCPKHGDFEQKAGDHLRGSGCSSCWSYTGRTLVYLVHIESHGEEMLKIGVTNHEVEQRFSDNLHPDQHATEIATLEFDDRQDAKTIEAYLHAKHKKHQFTPKVKFGGHTECFNIEAINIIKQDFGV